MSVSKQASKQVAIGAVEGGRWELCCWIAVVGTGMLEG